MPIKTFLPTVLTAADVNTYLMKQAVITCTSSTRPSSPNEGMTIYETDTDCYATYTGSAWAYQLGGVWSNYTPTLGNITLGNGTVSARWTRIGRTIRGAVQFAAGSSTTYGGGGLTISVPVTALSSSDVIGSGFMDNNTSGSRVVLVNTLSSTTQMNFQVDGGTVSNTFPLTTGTSTRIRVDFSYEAA